MSNVDEEIYDIKKVFDETFRDENEPEQSVFSGSVLTPYGYMTVKHTAGTNFFSPEHIFVSCSPKSILGIKTNDKYQDKFPMRFLNNLSQSILKCDNTVFGYLDSIAERHMIEDNSGLVSLISKYVPDIEKYKNISFEACTFEANYGIGFILYYRMVANNRQVLFNVDSDGNIYTYDMSETVWRKTDNIFQLLNPDTTIDKECTSEIVKIIVQNDKN